MVPCMWLQEMEKGVKEVAAGVEQLVDRIVSGELGGEGAHQADRYMSGFIKQMENTYSRFERAVQVAALWSSSPCLVPRVLLGC